VAAERPRPTCVDSLFLRLRSWSIAKRPPEPTPATSDAEKVRFNRINEATSHRIKMQKVDAETGEVDEARAVSMISAGSAPARSAANGRFQAVRCLRLSI
jgi:hypothetical protein